MRLAKTRHGRTRRVVKGAGFVRGCCHPTSCERTNHPLRWRARRPGGERDGRGHENRARRPAFAKASAGKTRRNSILATLPMEQRGGMGGRTTSPPWLSELRGKSPSSVWDARVLLSMILSCPDHSRPVAFIAQASALVPNILVNAAATLTSPECPAASLAASRIVCRASGNCPRRM